ncbi:MAG: hypothetical protein A2431_02355 [Candidatus Zambryskibacteria bacterium RIFOXYC1_FULL_39_10]|uniref:Glycosyltransferase 2-like domain-containing protein n=1 Tax=Candidatus Zambryskibacteria bacterium RIFOXYC1_FULL_39_10 TaxID=1802779 RepID=A0A1G2V3K7_9BACT|nr:MAG: hypothetical protein A2431_02355 [Candidatus Zambryskibacteria bacterium RIFOXYC1_FULL_39_10]OHB16758.1 MAG: hypothetical protein A2605_01205 [Candidatus Zambryskibacteria bacterium RIFOXYD1_FULL_39_35]
MKCDICIPVLNESSIIINTIRTIQEEVKKRPDIEWRIIVADNGSTDDTRQKVITAGLKNTILLSISEKGKGIAIRRAAEYSLADFFCFIDADLSVSPKNIAVFVDHLSTGKDIVIGSRFLDETKVKRSYLRTVSSKLFNFVARIILPIRVKDAQCGLKCMNIKGKEVLIACKETTWFLDLELIAQATSARLVVEELPIEWEEFYYVHRASKLRVVRDGLQALIAMMRIRQALKI